MTAKSLRQMTLWLATVAVSGGLAACAQMGSSRQPIDQRTNGQVNGHPRDSTDEWEDPGLRARMLNSRKEDRHRRMVDSANRLVEATRQLRAELQTRPTTAEDEKRLDEIARLARAVKDQMAGQ